ALKPLEAGGHGMIIMKTTWHKEVTFQFMVISLVLHSEAIGLKCLPHFFKINYFSLMIRLLHFISNECNGPMGFLPLKAVGSTRKYQSCKVSMTRSSL